ncbi:MAG: DUF6062 family protein [Spirochaetia bacterium]
MNYQLENIPVWKAYEAGASCPLCILEDKAERQYISFYLGNSVMAPEIRVKINKSGFCPDHWKQLLAGRNKLGMSLMISTHLETIKPLLEKVIKTGINTAGKKAQKEDTAPAGMVRECPVCARIDHALDNYSYTIVHLYKNEPDFPPVFSDSSGFCLPHTPRMISMASRFLNKKQKPLFIHDMQKIYLGRIQKLEENLNGFQQKFDYRSEGKAMTREEQEAVREAVLFLGGSIDEDT